MNKQFGFSLMEALLAIVVVAIAGLGAYTLFDSSSKTEHIAEATDEAVEIANVYTDLASSGLTSNGDDIPTLLQNSGRLSSKYFSSSSTVTMNNAFGQLSFSSVTPYSFVVTFPLGCSSDNVDSLSSIAGQFYSKVKDLYSCDASGDKTYATCSKTACVQGHQTSITLYFNMNH